MGYEAELLSQININRKEFPPDAPLSDYNVFHILGISAKEVIMCRFLADLLNPEGRHGCGISFLKSFMHDVFAYVFCNGYDETIFACNVREQVRTNSKRRVNRVI